MFNDNMREQANSFSTAYGVPSLYHVVSAVAEEKQQPPDDGVVPVVVRVELLVEDVAALSVGEEPVVLAVSVVVVVGYRARYDPACSIDSILLGHSFLCYV